MASAQTARSSQKYSEPQMSGRYLKGTIALDVQWQTYATGVVSTLSIMGEITVGTKFRRSGGMVGGCIKGYQDVQLQFLTRISSATLPSLAFLLAFC